MRGARYGGRGVAGGTQISGVIAALDDFEVGVGHAVHDGGETGAEVGGGEGAHGGGGIRHGVARWSRCAGFGTDKSIQLAQSL